MNWKQIFPVAEGGIALGYNLNIKPDKTKKLETLFKKYDLLAVYLFGSQVDGTAHAKSDYDFGLLFKILPALEETSLLMLEIEEEAAKILNREVDIVILNSATIEQRFMIISRGVLLYTSDDDKRTDFEDITIRDYLDFKPFLDLYHKEVREEIKKGDFFVEF